MFSPAEQPSDERRPMNLIARGLRSFGQFWWEFLIGDAPELFGATVVIVVLALVLRHHRDVAYIVVPSTAIILLVASTLGAARRSRRGS
jgi:hypothetical protein